MHHVRSATRRRYSSEEKTRIVLEGFRHEVTVKDLCQREGIKPYSYYSWTEDDFGGMYFGAPSSPGALCGLA